MRIQPDNPLLVYSGRIDWSHSHAPVFIFPCTSVSVRFTGQVLKVHVETRHAYWDNFLGYSGGWDDGMRNSDKRRRRA